MQLLKSLQPVGINQDFPEFQSQKAEFYFLPVTEKYSGSSKPAPNWQKSGSHLCSEVV